MRVVSSADFEETKNGDNHPRGSDTAAIRGGGGYPPYPSYWRKIPLSDVLAPRATNVCLAILIICYTPGDYWRFCDRDKK